jgi:hypothetical protein
MEERGRQGKTREKQTIILTSDYVPTNTLIALLTFQKNPFR